MSILKNLKYIEDNRDIDTTDKEEDFLDDISEISKPYLKSVILSNKKLMVLYNKLIEIDEYYLEKNEIMNENDKEIMDFERAFTEKIKGITKKANLIEIINKNKGFLSLYNSTVDLFNHYTKKLQLSKSIRNV